MKLSELKTIQHLLPDDTEVQIVSAGTGVCTPTTSVPLAFAKWRLWAGWCGNHDRRIEDAKCSNCGYQHPTVFGSLDKLGKACPNCGMLMNGCEES